jgi:hypothetical protein
VRRAESKEIEVDGEEKTSGSSSLLTSHSSASICRRPTGYALVGLIALGASAFWLTFWYWFVHPGLNHIDAYAHLPWMLRWRDPGLFPNDLMTDYFQRYHLTPGLRGVYYILVAVAGMDLNTASCTVAAICFILTFVTLIATTRQSEPGVHWSPTIVGLAAGLLIMAWPRSAGVNLFYWLDGGLARAPASVVLLLVVYGLARPSMMALNLSLLLGALTYPPSFVLAFTAATIAGFTMGRWRAVWVFWIKLLPGALLAALVVLLWYPLRVDERFGPLISWADVAWAPEILPHHFPHRPTFLTGALTPWLTWNVSALVSLAFLAYLSGFDRFWRANAIVLVAGLTATVASYVAWPKLYDVERYISWPQRVVLITTVATIGTRSIGAASARWKPRSGALAGAIVVGSVACIAGAGFYRVWKAPVPAYPPSTTIDFIAAVPIDARIAAYPGDGDTIPFLARRSLLVHPVALYPYHVTFYREARRRFWATRDAVYATDWAAVRRLRDEFEVNYLVVNRARYRPADFASKLAGHVCLRHMAAYTQELRDRGPDQRFVLRDPPGTAIAVEDGDFVVIDLSRIP